MFWAVSLCRAEESVTTLDTIVITATKRETAADDFPGSISVKDDDFIYEHTIRDVEELSRFIPNVYYKRATSGDALVSRGISTIDTSLYSPMGLYINEAAYPLSYMQSHYLFDVQRVEVLRGPRAPCMEETVSRG